MVKSKIIKYLKKTFAFLLVLAINVNTYAAVGGNDGSAFITKAEFDAIVNTFNDQMDAYEGGLVSKIDGAIANYLAGLSSKVTLTLDDLATNVAKIKQEYITFYNYPTTDGYDAAAYQPKGKAGSYYLFQSRANNAGVYVRLSSNRVTVGNVQNSLVNFGTTDNCFYMFNDTEIADDGSGYDEGKAIFLQSKNSYKNEIKIQNQGVFSSITNWGGSLDVSVVWSNTTKNHTVDIKNENGFAGNYTDTESGLKLGGESVSANADISSTWTEAKNPKFAGTGYPSSGKIKSQNMRGIKYSNRGLFDGAQQTINGCYGSDAGGRVYTYQNSNTRAGSQSPSGGQSWVYKFYWHKIFATNVLKVCNYGASSVLNKPVYLYNGIPLTKVSNVGKVKFSCTLTNSKGNDTYLTISDEPFDNANRYATKTYTAGGKTYDHILYNQKIAAGKSNDIEFDVSYIASKTEPTVLYYRLSQETFTDSAVSMFITMDTGITMEVEDD